MRGSMVPLATAVGTAVGLWLLATGRGAAVVAGAATVAACASVWGAWAQQRWPDARSQWRALGPYLLWVVDLVLLRAVADVAMSVVRPLLSEGALPTLHDHAAHAYKSWWLSRQAGVLAGVHGWNDLLLLGDPEGDLYPVGGDVFVSIVDRLTGMRKPFHEVYARAVGWQWVIASGGVFLGARRFVGRAGAFVAAFLFATDLGAWEEGVHWGIHFGVWPQFLGLGLGMLAMDRLAWTLDRPSPPRVALTALPLALSVLCHPLCLLFFGPAMALYVLFRGLATADEGGAPLGRSTLAWLGAMALTGALIAWWQLPYAALAPTHAASFGVQAQQADDLGRHLLTGQVFHEGWSWFEPIALLGAIAALLRRRPGPAAFAVLGFALLYVAAQESTYDLSLLDVSPFFRRIWYTRLYGVTKVAWMLSAGHAVALALHVAPRPARAPVRWTDGARRAVPLALAAACLAPFANGLRVEYRAHRDALRAEARHTPPEAAAWREYLAWSTSELRPEFDRGFFRVMHVTIGTDEHHAYTAALSNGLPVYKARYTPGVGFNNFPGFDNLPGPDVTEELMDMLSVRYVVCYPNCTAAHATPVRTFGPYRVWRRTSQAPGRLAAVGATVSDLRWERERVRFRVDRADAGAVVRLGIGYYPRWRATIDGRPVALRERPIVEGRPGSILEVPVRAGEVVVTYERLPVFHVGYAATLLGLATSAAFLLWRWGPFARRRASLYARWLARRASAWARWVPRVGWVWAVVPLAAWAAAHPRTGRWRVFDFRKVPPDEARYDTPSGGQRCRWERDDVLRRGRWHCEPLMSVGHAFRETICQAQLSTAPVESVRDWVEQAPEDALYVPTVVPGVAVMTWRAARLGRSLRGLLMVGERTPISAAEAPEVRLELMVDGSSQGFVSAAVGPARFEFDTSRFAGGQHRVELRVRSPRALDVCVAATAHRF